jgi:deoxyadenosine/deoxycytidine kinase
MRIAIDGNIACGKSTLMQSLHQKIGLAIRVEPIANWYPILTKFYDDPSGWALSMNLQVMITFAQWKNDQGVVLYERCPRACRDVFTALNIEGGFMDPLQGTLFDKLYEQMGWEPDVLIYLRTEPKNCMERLKTRARECESSVTLEYEQALHNKYEAMAHSMQNQIEMNHTGAKNSTSHCSRVFIVNGDQSIETVYNDVVRILQDLGALRNELTLEQILLE